MSHQHVFTIVSLTTTSRLALILILVLNTLTMVTCAQQQQTTLKQTVQKLQNDGWNSTVNTRDDISINTNKNSLSANEDSSMSTTGSQFLLDKKEDEDDVDDDEETSSTDSGEDYDSNESKDKLNNTKDDKNDFKQIDSKVKNENQKLKKRTTQIRYKQPDNLSLNVNRLNTSSYQTESHDSKSNKSEFSLIDQINNQFSKLNSSNQLSNQLDKQSNKLQSIQSNKMPFYYNRRLKTRHVTSGDQLRILRREGQSLRLSCLPAFHAPSRSTVNWFKNGDLIKIPEQNILYKWSLQLKYLRPEDGGVYECVVQNSQLGRTSVLYRLKVLPSFISSITNENSNLQPNQEKNQESNLKANGSNANTSTRLRKSVLDSYHQTNLIDWSTNDNKRLGRLDKKYDDTVLSLHNVTVERLGQKAILRCVVDGSLAQPHFRWFFKLGPIENSTQLINSNNKNEIKLPNLIDNQSADLFNQLYQNYVYLNVNSNVYQSLVNEDQLNQLNGKHYYRLHQQTINQSSNHQINQFALPIHKDNVYIESYKVFLPSGAFSYASELTVQVDQPDLGEYLCVNFGASIHYKSAFIKLKEIDSKSKHFYLSSLAKKVDENSTLDSRNRIKNENLFLNTYGWFNEDYHNVAMIRHSPSSASKLNYIQHDKLNVPISAAIITADQQTKSNEYNENLSLIIIVPITIGILVIVIILFSLVNHLKKIPNIPDLTDQCLIVQQIKPIMKPLESANDNESNLIVNPLSEENLDVDDLLKSTVENQTGLSNQVINTNQTVAQLTNEIYHPVVNGHHKHSHLLIKPPTNYYSSIIQTDKNYFLKNDKTLGKSLNCENSIQSTHHHSINLNSYYLNNKAQLDYEHTAFGSISPTAPHVPQQWSNVNVNCCDTCPCNRNQHRTPD